jgi:hypothetical protein
VAFFLKQLGGHPSKRGGSDALLDGMLWHEKPTIMSEQVALSVVADRADLLPELQATGRVRRPRPTSRAVIQHTRIRQARR